MTYTDLYKTANYENKRKQQNIYKVASLMKAAADSDNQKPKKQQKQQGKAAPKSKQEAEKKLQQQANNFAAAPYAGTGEMVGQIATPFITAPMGGQIAQFIYDIVNRNQPYDPRTARTGRLLSYIIGAGLGGAGGFFGGKWAGRALGRKLFDNITKDQLTAAKNIQEISKKYPKLKQNIS